MAQQWHAATYFLCEGFQPFFMSQFQAVSNIYDTMEEEAKFMMALLEDTDWNDESDHNCSNELLIIFEGLIVAVVVEKQVTYVIDIYANICLSIP